MPDNTVTREILGNVDVLSRWIFYVLTAMALGSFVWGFYKRWSLWKTGRSGGRNPGVTAGIGNLFSSVLWQPKVRRQRSGTGRAHGFLFIGFLVLFIGTVL